MFFIKSERLFSALGCGHTCIAYDSTDLSHAQVCAGSVRPDPRALARSRLQVKALYGSCAHVTEMVVLDMSHGCDGGIKRGTERGETERDREWGGGGLQHRVKYKMSALFPYLEREHRTCSTGGR